MKEIRKGLYLGDIDDAVSFLTDESFKFKHVLSLVHLTEKAIEMRCKLSSKEKKKKKSLVRAEVVQKEVLLTDSESQNLLERLEECLEFVECGRQAGGVLVHCFQGLSRSASVVIAYLMRSEKLSLKDALLSIRQDNKLIRPNDGFMHQLELFHEMNFCVDKDNAVYDGWTKWTVREQEDGEETTQVVSNHCSSQVDEETLIEDFHTIFNT